MSSERLFTRAFVLCSAANLAQCLAFNLFLHFPGFLAGLGAGEVQIGFIFGLTAVAAIAARPPIGRSMDRSGRRGVILLGGVLNCLVCALYLSVDAIGAWLIAIRVLHGVAEAMLFTALFTYAADFVPAGRRTEGLALFGVSGMLPIALSAQLGDVILRHAGFGVLFQVALAFAAISLLLSLPLRDRPRGSPGEGEASQGFGAALAQTDLLPLWWIGLVFATALSAVFTFVKLYVEGAGLGSVGGFFTAYSTTAVALRILLGWLPDRLGPKRVLFPALCCLAAAFLLLGWAEEPRDVVLAGVCFGIGHGYTFPILFGIVVTRSREADRGSAMAIYTALFDAGMALGGPSFGAIARAEGYPAMFRVGGLVVLAGTAVFALWDRRRD